MTAPVLAKAISLAVPAGLTAGALDTLAETRFSNTITLGSIILALLVMIVAGYGAVRSQIAKNYRESWQSEKDLRLEKEEALARCHEQMSVEREEQRAVRHQLKDDLATAKAQIAVLETRTDFTAYEQRAVARNEAVLDGLRAVTESLHLIASQLKGAS